MSAILDTAASAASQGGDFAALRREITDAGLLERRYGSYLTRIVLTIGAFAAAWAVFGLLGNTWLQLITATVLGVLFTQVGFLGHDGAHRQVWRSRRANDLLSVASADVLMGLSFAWWVDKHNRHHAHPNQEGRDPDIGGRVLAFTPSQIAARDGRVGRLVARHQAALFFPLLAMEGLHMHVASARFLVSAPAGPASRYRRLELLLFGGHVVAYLAALLLVLDPLRALVFLAVHQVVFGLYMGCSFAPNHKGMPTLGPEEKVDYLRRQVLTSRNVRGGWFTDLALGGLNYQVEHHLFPRMPRANLRRAQAIVRAHCRNNAIDYTETSLLGSYATVLQHLHTLGAPLRRVEPGAENR